MSDKYESVSLFVYISHETTALKKTVDIICEECSPDDIDSLYLVFKDTSNKEGLMIAEKLKNDYSRFPIIIYFQKADHIYGAVYESFTLAKSSHLTFLPADLETDPHLVKTFIEMAKKNPNDIITASRWIKGSKVEGYSLGKKIAISFIRQYFLILYKTSLTDLTFPYLIYPMELFEKIRFDSPQSFLWELTIKAMRLGVTVTEIPIEWHKSDEKSSFTLADLIKRGFTFLYLGVSVRLKSKEKIIK